ncbi:putative ankyrin repeat protein RF_0381 [Haliotis rubra]|uniref:putative ankyrin repeat protein RF_0381 n=1 Tax=Haliotis rubra TaxID=36100 RepID=UPI001EE55FC7|nr:putative ankyrin repeat protein RF_0381 [Haliotis rubra]
MEKNNMTPVMHAARGGHEEVFDLLVREGANLSLLDDWDMNILHLASIGGSVDIVKYVLVQKIVGINSRDKDGWTPAMKAALYKNKDVFDLLVEERADLLLVGDDKETILHVACQGGNVEIIQYLLTQDTVGIDKQDENGWTPVMHAAKGGHEAVFDVLVDKGADLSPVDGDKETILHVACEGGNVEIIKYLLKHDIVNINCQDGKGWTPIMHAAMSGHKGVFDVLVEGGADLSLVGDYKMNTLYAACKGGNVEITQYLLKHDIVNIDCQDGKGWTPIMHAAMSGHKGVFDVLVDEGADLSLLCDDKETILHVACEGGNVEIIKYILKHDIVDIGSRDANGWTPLMYGVSNGNEDVFDVLVEAGADLSLVTNDNETILHVACVWGSFGITKYLLTHEIVDIDSRDNNGLTAVMATAMGGSIDVFKLLVKWGADLSLLTDTNQNILHLACSHGGVEIVKYLLTHNIVDINSRDGKECTPAMIAAYKGREAVFFLLVDHRADLTIMNDAGDNILNLACNGENAHIVKYVSTRHVVEGPYKEDDPC